MNMLDIYLLIFLIQKQDFVDIVYSRMSESSMYHQQQNKWYPQKCLLVHFEAPLDFSRSEFNCT